MGRLVSDERIIENKPEIIVKTTDNRIKDLIFFIATGMGLSFTLLVYIHSNFTTEASTNRNIERSNTVHERVITRLHRIEDELNELNKNLIQLIKEGRK